MLSLVDGQATPVRLGSVGMVVMMPRVGGTLDPPVMSPSESPERWLISGMKTVTRAQNLFTVVLRLFLCTTCPAITVGTVILKSNGIFRILRTRRFPRKTSPNEKL